MSSPDHKNIYVPEAVTQLLDRKQDVGIEVVRAITVLPTDRSPLGFEARFGAAIGAMALGLEFDSLTLRAYCPRYGEPLQFHVGQRGTVAHRAPEEQQILSNRLEALLALLWPMSAFSMAVGSLPDLPVSTTIRPAVEKASPVPANRPRLYGRQTAAEEILIDRMSNRVFDVEAALSVMPLEAPCELAFQLSPFRLDARMLRALHSLEIDRRAERLASGTAGSAIDDVLPRYISALRAAGAGIRIDAIVRFAKAPDPMVLDLVSAALYGAPADRAPSGALDLRSVWPLGWPLPSLLPREVSHRRMIERARRAAPCQPALAGSVSLGRAMPYKDEIVIAPRDRARHLYCLGSTGTGKSTLLLNLLHQDMCGGGGVILIDPHGDLADSARALVPAARRKDLIWSDLSDPNSVLGLNILEGQGLQPELERNYVCNQLIGLFKDVLYRGVPEAFGPMFETYFRNALMLLMSGGGPEANLMDFERVFHDAVYRRNLIANCPDHKVREFWNDVAEKVTYTEISLENVAPYIACKLTQLTGNPLVRRMIGVRKSGLDLRSAMNDGGIVLIKLAKGLIGDYDATLIATLLTIRIAQVGMARATLPPERRCPIRVYIDEFQNCSGESLTAMLAESRKYGISLTLANQSLSQIDGRGTHNDAGEAALANAANLVVFRVGAPDAARLAPWFEPEMNWQELCRLPDFQAAVRVLENGRPGPARAIELAPPPSSVAVSADVNGIRHRRRFPRQRCKTGNEVTGQA